MKVRELLRLLLWPLVAGALILVLLTFVTWAAEGQSNLLDYLLGIIDLREERTFGTWFESLLFVLTGLSFFLVSRHTKLPLFGKGLFVLMALGFCFLSADESLALHEFLGYEFEQATGIVDDTALAQRGYSWILLYAPVALIVFGLLIRFYHSMFKAMTGNLARNIFCLGWVAVGGVVFLEATEGWSFLAGTDRLSMLTCVEESIELTALLLLYTSNLLIAESFEL